MTVTVEPFEHEETLKVLRQRLVEVLTDADRKGKSLLRQIKYLESLRLLPVYSEEEPKRYTIEDIMERAQPWGWP